MPCIQLRLAILKKCRVLGLKVRHRKKILVLRAKPSAFFERKPWLRAARDVKAEEGGEKEEDASGDDGSGDSDESDSDSDSDSDEDDDDYDGIYRWFITQKC